MLHLAVPILPEHIWTKISAKQVTTYKNSPTDTVKPVGSGPYVLAERKVGQYVRLVANKTYWAGAPHMDELIFRVYASPEALAQALKKGEIDIADSLEANVFDSLKGQPGITTLRSKYSGFNEIAFNVGAALVDGTPIGDGHPALKDKAVRLALATPSISTPSSTGRSAGTARWLLASCRRCTTPSTTAPRPPTPSTSPRPTSSSTTPATGGARTAYERCPMAPGPCGSGSSPEPSPSRRRPPGTTSRSGSPRSGSRSCPRRSPRTSSPRP
ncbi:MAG: hypothetical protein IPH03_03820 [Tetrasphaera sp.]|nr:hypothetical protein [Tetrasphaera sp.]